MNCELISDTRPKTYCIVGELAISHIVDDNSKPEIINNMRIYSRISPVSRKIVSYNLGYRQILYLWETKTNRIVESIRIIEQHETKCVITSDWAAPCRQELKVLRGILRAPPTQPAQILTLSKYNIKCEFKQ